VKLFKESVAVPSTVMPIPTGGVSNLPGLSIPSARPAAWACRIYMKRFDGSGTDLLGPGGGDYLNWMACAKEDVGGGFSMG
jgi:hypothetical protein